MNYITYGMSNAQVSEVILGMMRISEMSVEEVEGLVDTALAAGINALDLADIYGHGQCESILGEVLKKRPDLRNQIWLQSKCGIRMDADFTWFDFSGDYILEAVDGILSRLHTDHLDSLLLHRPDALMEPEEIADAFATLHREGKVLDFGVSNMNPMQMDLLQSALPFAISTNQIQLSCAFTPAIDSGFQVNMKWDGAMMRDGGILEYARLNDMAIQSWSSLQYGFFEGVFLGSDKYEALNRVLDRIAKEKGVTDAAVALAWILRYPAKMQTVVGTTNPQRLEDSAKASEVELTKKEWYEIYLAAGNKLP